ncbi:response regulator [Microcoleus sp. FACHB-831]|uniref:response regulator n=1 Tax=Microcoleus sp. FACHB-831 TaxID=2692827 RepID=UPI001681EF83|nr:response regulator [Microcoleus sp. FACHB-831]MBD1920356.1 response regulator [Microcoleus sp. FACHB-831]
MCYQSLPPLDGLQVLVVDNDPDSRYLLTLVFEEYGVKTIGATSVGEAIEILKHITPDLLISELGLPKEDGYSLMRRVKALESGRSEIPAIALTAYAMESDRSQALSVGFYKHLSKPFDIDELIKTVACLIFNKQFQTVPT